MRRALLSTRRGCVRLWWEEEGVDGDVCDRRQYVRPSPSFQLEMQTNNQSPTQVLRAAATPINDSGPAAEVLFRLVEGQDTLIQFRYVVCGRYL